MRVRQTLLLMGLAAAAVQAGAAAIYRCTAPDGAVTYQETACAGEATGAPVNIPSAYPDFNVVERDRILQREALLDARLLRRAELDSAERIARDDRIAREKEAAAELAAAEAMAAAGGGIPVSVAGRPFVRHHRAPSKFQRHSLRAE